MSLKGVEELLEQREAEEDEVDFDEEDAEEPKPKKIKEAEPEKETRIETIRGKEFIRIVDARRFPCKNCLKDLVNQCREDLEKGFKIEFFRPNNTCVTWTGGADEE